MHLNLPSIRKTLPLVTVHVLHQFLMLIIGLCYSASNTDWMWMSGNSGQSWGHSHQDPCQTRASPKPGSGQAGPALPNLHMWPESDLNEKFDVIIAPNVSPVCQDSDKSHTSRMTLDEAQWDASHTHPYSGAEPSMLCLHPRISTWNRGSMQNPAQVQHGHFCSCTSVNSTSFKHQHTLN